MAVVAKAEAELADKAEQLKTVTESIESILAQMAPADAAAWREKQAADKAAAAEVFVQKEVEKEKEKEKEGEGEGGRWREGKMDVEIER